MSDDIDPLEQSAQEDEPFSLPLNKIPRRERDQRLWALLPEPDAPYDPMRLSRAESAALDEALCDGFGSRVGTRTTAVRLPGGIYSGLPGHKFYVQQYPTEDLDPEDERIDWEFWGEGDYASDGPPTSEDFPLGFYPNRLRIYFRNQINRHCFHANKNEFDSLYDVVRDENFLASLGWEQLYEKPCYELHALQFLDWIEDPEFLKSPLFIVTGFAGRLGRLVEQYYWRFRFEESAKTGLGALGGASAGGMARARKKRNQHARWQASADRIWAQNPSLLKSKVAERVKEELRLSYTIKHIGRFIQKKLKK